MKYEKDFILWPVVVQFALPFLDRGNHCLLLQVDAIDLGLELHAEGNPTAVVLNADKNSFRDWQGFLNCSQKYWSGWKHYGLITELWCVVWHFVERKISYVAANSVDFSDEEAGLRARFCVSDSKPGQFKFCASFFA